MHRTLLLLLCAIAPLVFAGVPPAPPVIVEPDADDLVLNAADVHMMTAPFADADGNGHRCTDWEIREGHELEWSAPCVTGAIAIHIHLGDGTFARGFNGLRNEAAYVLRVRHRDDSNEPATEWSAWSERRFRTAPGSPMPALLARDFLAQPAPRWTRTDSETLELPNGASLRLEAADGEPLVELFGNDGSIASIDAAPFTARTAVRAVLRAGDEAWTLPESDVTLLDDDAVEHTIHLPSTQLAAAQAMYFWISANGSTHEAHAEDRVPDFTKIARGASVPWTAMQKGYVIERVADNLALPVNIAFVPFPRDDQDSPFYYVTELYGIVKVVTRGGEVRDYAKNLINFVPDGSFPGAGETGITGITVEPQSGDVLVATIYWNGFAVVPRILRLESDDGGLTAARITTVLDMPKEQQSPSHQISNLSIGPDGKVYFHMGDGINAANAQDMTVMRGKILRMNLDGSAAEDNPFYDASDGISATDYIFALGFRNPFGGAWRSADGNLYEVENGPSLDRFARVDKGFNYGWDGTNESMATGAICTFPTGAAPVNVAFVQDTTFGGSGFPEDKFDHAFVAESGPTWASGTPYAGKRISEIAVNLDGTLQSGPTAFLRYDGTGKATVAGLAAGPDGLYFTSLYKDFGYEQPVDRGAAVFRVRWTGYADFRFTADTRDPMRIELSDASVLANAESWRWEFGDGTSSDDGKVIEHRYSRPGAYLVTLTVTRRGGETFAATKRIFLSTGGAGLRADYFPNLDLTGMSVRRFERKLDWDGTSELPFTAEQFSVRWSGRLMPRVSETHRFVAEASGDVRVWLDGNEVTDDVALEAGRLYKFVVEYVHREGVPQMRLSWESDSQPLEVVPPSVLFAPEGTRRRAARN